MSSWWHVEFAVIPAGKQAGDEEDVEMWVESANSRDALLCATARLLLNDGDLLHGAHVSPPFEKRGKEYCVPVTDLERLQNRTPESMADLIRTRRLGRHDGRG